MALRILLFSGAVALFCPAHQVWGQVPAPFFPVGVWYGGGPVRPPMLARDPARERDAWVRDLEGIRSLGFNHVKTRVDWATAEPTHGEYRLEALEQLLSLAGRAGLRVIVQIYSDSAPEWVRAAHPDASFVSDESARLGSQAAPGYCLDHERVRADVARFIRAVSDRARKYSAFYALDVWSDPHIQFCFCPHTLARFRGWLQNKYGSLEAINRAWDRTFSAWEQVEPPRGGTTLSHADFIDWKTFNAARLEEDLRMKAEAARGDGTSRRTPISSHSDVPAVLLTPLSGFGSSDDWWMTRAVDHYGISIYPKHASAAAPWSPVQLMAGLDGIRSAAGERGWWNGELQAGQGATGVRVGAPVTAADLRLWGWSVISRGARAVSYYAWHPTSPGNESGGYGLIEPDGGITDRARAAGALADLIGRNANLFTALRPERAPVAIVYNRLSYMAGGNTVARGQTARISILGAYRALYRRNVPVNFVHPDEIVAGALGRYRAVYFPYPIMMPRDVAAALREYVHQGGLLVAEARPAWNDERGFASAQIPGAGLDAVFGAREAGFRATGTMMMRVAPGLPVELRRLEGRDVPGSGCLETLRLTEATPLAVLASGEPVAAINAYGSGRAVLIGSFIAAAFDQDPVKNAAAGELLAALADLAGARPRVLLSGAPAGVTEARLMESDRAMLLIAINHDTSPHRVRLELPIDAPAGEWQNLETSEAIPLAGRAGAGPALEHRFGARDVLVLLARKPPR